MLLYGYRAGETDGNKSPALPPRDRSSRNLARSAGGTGCRARSTPGRESCPDTTTSGHDNLRIRRSPDTTPTGHDNRPDTMIRTNAVAASDGTTASGRMTGRTRRPSGRDEPAPDIGTPVRRRYGMPLKRASPGGDRWASPGDLAGLAVRLVRLAVGAVLLQLKPIRVVAPVLPRDVVAVLALLAGQRDLRPNVGGSHLGVPFYVRDWDNPHRCPCWETGRVVAEAGLEPATQRL